MAKVFIPHKGPHDYSQAEKFGELVFLSDGLIVNKKVNFIYQQCFEGMRDAAEDDCLLISGLPIVVSIASAILVERFGRVNYLIWAGNDYVQRRLVLRRNENGSKRTTEQLIGS